MAGIIVKAGSFGLAIIPNEKIAKKEPKELIREIRGICPDLRIYDQFGRKVIVWKKGGNIETTA